MLDAPPEGGGTQVCLPRKPGVSARPRSSSLGVLAGCLVVTALVSAWFLAGRAAGPGFSLRGVPLDDVWIHLVYARSIARGEPFQYNPGEPETGSTSPLWAVLLAPGALLGIPVAWAKALGVLLTGLTAWLGWRLVRALDRATATPGHPSRAHPRREEDARLAVAVALSVPLLPYLAFAAVSGTEVALASLLVLAVMERAVAGRLKTAGVMAGLAVLARPELAVLVVVLAAALAVRPRPHGRRIRTTAVETGVPLVLACAVAAPWVAFCLAVTGRPLPSTFYAKAAWHGAFPAEGLARIGAWLTSQPFFGAELGVSTLTVIGALSGLALYAAGMRRLARAGPRALLLVGGFGPAFLLAVAAVVPLGEVLPADAPGSVRNFYFARYLLPALPTMVLVWWLGLAELAGIRRLRRVTGSALAAALLALPVATTVRQLGSLRAVYSWNCRNVEELQVRAARWIAANLPPEATVGVSDAGAMRYFGEHRIVDLVGLNSHRVTAVARALREASPGGEDERRLRASFWRLENPTFLAVTSAWHRGLLRGRPLQRLATFRIEHNTICAAPEVVILATDRR